MEESRCTPIDVIIPTFRSMDEVASLVGEIEATAGCPCRVIPTCQPLSASGNRNWGLDHSESDPFLMVDDDMERFPQGWVAKLIEVLASRPNCVMVSPQLAKPDGTPGIMMGNGDHRRDGVTVSGERKLATACIAMRRTGLRFDERFRGSGWEDSDYCFQLVQAFPEAEFCIRHDLWIVHLNQMKNQHGENWKFNMNLCLQKWGHT